MGRGSTMRDRSTTHTSDEVGREVYDVKVSRGQGRDTLARRGERDLHLGIEYCPEGKCHEGGGGHLELHTHAVRLVARGTEGGG
jgi:hypothetical protein